MSERKKEMKSETGRAGPVRPVETDGRSLRIGLCAIRGETSTYIDAAILENGDLQLSGQDLGKAPLEIFGDSDYEYWLTVPREHKDHLLLLLLGMVYHGDVCVVSKLKDLLDAHSIPNTFFSYA